MSTNYGHLVHVPKVAPKRMFKAMVHESHLVLPEAAPHAIKKMYFAEGNGGVGSIWVTEFVEGQQVKYLKFRIVLIDEGNLIFKYTVIEGELIGGRIESVTIEIKFEGDGHGGCVLQMTHECHQMKYCSFVEQHLVNNPRLCL